MNRPRLAHTRATLTASVVSFVACASPPPRAAEPPAPTPRAAALLAPPATPALTETRRPDPPEYVPAQPDTPPGKGQETYPTPVSPLVVISSDHRDCPADRPAPRIYEYLVSEDRLCLGWSHGQNAYERWVFAPADPPSDGPARRSRYRLCIGHLGMTTKQLALEDLRFAIAVKDFPGGEIPELVNLPLQNRPKDFPPHIPPLSCNALAPTVRLAVGEPVPLVRNLPALERVHTGWELRRGETFDMEGLHRPGDRRRR